MADEPMETVEVTEEAKAEAEASKAQANKAFGEKKYAVSIVHYTKAIDSNPMNAIYYANRAFAHIKMENYGSALADATKAIQVDPKYVKGYYRRGSAYLFLNNFKGALKDFKTVAKVTPNDKDAQVKLKECEKEVKRLKFEDAISSDHDTIPQSEQVDFEAMPIDDSYDGPRMDKGEDGQYVVTARFVEEMVEHFKSQKQIHKHFAFKIVMDVLAILRKAPTLVDIPVPEGTHFTVCGDVHGQFYDLVNIFDINGRPSPDNPYLFNGDFVDRGSFAAEVILTLFAYKALYPDSMFLSRGNHETTNMNKIYGFHGEICAKFNENLSLLFREVFCWLPLGAVIGEKVFVVHGGLFSTDGVTLDDIRKIDRVREPPDEGIMCEMLWSDPMPTSQGQGRGVSKRGVGVQFGSDVTARFLEDNNLELVVRSHEVKDEGFEVDHDGRLVTVFSAPNYCDQMGNKGAFIKFNSDMAPNFTKFAAVPHPPVRPMAYASGLLNMV
mmetsp:Transcript_57149/g.180878  ORF Transcript_57149/g.180878 Transcript_57149/m.180878 type:complete len:496 (+) Transcript_57149:241-1728(+)